MEHELHGFFRSYSRKLAEDYAAIRPRSLEDPGTSGDQGEESWARMLRDWLPEGYSVVTKGRILGASGRASPQVDVIVLKPNYPKFLKGHQYYLLDGVAAAFECKLTLKANHIEKVMQNAKLIAELQSKPSGSPQREIFSPFVYGLLAHSHAWRDSNDAVVARVTEKLHDVGQQANEPRELPELVCVADLAGWRISHCSLAHFIIADWAVPDPEVRSRAIDLIREEYAGFPQKVHRTPSYIQLWVEKPHSEYGVQYYPEHVNSNAPPEIWERFTPVGAFIAALYDKLAYRDPSLLNISNYFREVHIPASSGGVNMAKGKLQWPRSVITDATWAASWNQGVEWQEVFF
ncbi:DUF6602 domain-containing protein [Variovorax sp.]|uniref:DUF6602 domain-containing protein n=1 Tax=Variovorax sp. TaxID=1871043 RepID=UPI0025D7502A|nr:DUF6602 domain-containing protein [Variovorax sp.]